MIIILTKVKNNAKMSTTSFTTLHYTEALCKTIRNDQLIRSNKN